MKIPNPVRAAFAPTPEQDRRVIVNIGPSHPATHGTVQIITELDGERVLRADVHCGYLHRGFEKDVVLSDGKVLVKKGRPITKGSWRKLIKDGQQTIEVAPDSLIGQYLAQDIVDGNTGEVVAHLRNLPGLRERYRALYHSLARVSFRLHTDAGRGAANYRPEDFGLTPAAEEFLTALAQVFEAIGAVPTPGEYGRILADLHARVRTEEQLRQCLFGWMENLDRAALYARPLEPLLAAAQGAINRYFGLEEIELGGE